MTGRKDKHLVGACLRAAFVFALLASAAASNSVLQRPARATTTWVVMMEASDMGVYFFSPSRIVVGVGDTVTWMDMAGAQTTTADAGQAEYWDSQTMSEGQSYAHTFDTPGSYSYYSKSFDHGMVGRVVVQAVVPEFPGFYVLVTVGLASCAALALERELRRNPLPCDATSRRS